MRVLITGGAGFIGAHVGHALRERGDTVVVVDDFNDYYDPALKQARVRAVLGEGVTVIRADVTDAANIERVIREHAPEAVLHFAAWAGVRPSREHAAQFAAVNIQGTVNVLEACARAAVRRIVFASSSSVYGRSGVIPTPEDADADQPASGYGVTKRAGELYARLYHQLDGLRIACLRFFTVYGPWGRPDMAVWKFTDRILRGLPILLNVRARDGREVLRDFTEVSDIVRGTLAALDANHVFSVVNLGASYAVPLRQLVAEIERATGKQAVVEERVLPDDEAISTGADLTRAASLLGFQPRVSLEEGVRRFIAWYQSEYRAQLPHGIAPSRFWH